MNFDLSTANVATILVVLLVLAGCVVAVVHPETLSFDQLLDKAGPLVGGLAVGRGLATIGRNRTT